MPPLKTYDVFISHAWHYDDDYHRIVNLLGNAPNFKWRNYSVPQHDPKDANSPSRLKEALKRQMRPANVFLILSGMYVAYSDWIDFEIEFGLEISKPMIGVRPRGQQRVPKKVSDSVNEMVGWQTSSIVEAIRRHSL